MSRFPQKASLSIVFLTVFVDLLGFGMVLPLVPVYAKTLTAGYSPAQTAWSLGLLMSCYSMMQFLFSPFWGRLSDRVGRRPILLLSLGSSACFYTLFGVATMRGSLSGMFLSRIGGGIAGATIPTAQAYIADVTPPEKRTRGMALIGVAFGLGFTFGPLLGALALLSAADAHLSPWPGYAAGTLSTAALVVAWFQLAESIPGGTATHASEHVDLASLRRSLAVPSIGVLLAVLFCSNFGFASFEATLPLVLADFLNLEHGGYKILLVFAYIGSVQTVVQGGLVRWMATFTSEATLGVIGVLLAILGYGGLALAAHPASGGVMGLMVAGSVVVSGLGFVYPSVQSLISRRSDPAKQGGVLGFGGGINSVARIAGIILAMQLRRFGGAVPFWATAGLMCAVLLLVSIGVGRGHDWQPSAGVAGEATG